MKKSNLALAVVAGLLTQHTSAAGFIEDSKATLGLRNFYIDQNTKHTTDRTGEAREWGQGFLFNYSSGFTQGTVGFGLDAIGLAGVKLDSGGDGVGAERTRTPGQLFPRDSAGKAVDEYSKGGVTAKARISKTELRLGSLQPKLPVVSFNDGRLLPQLFQGGQITSTDIEHLTLTAGQLEKTKTRSSTDDVNLRIATPSNNTLAASANSNTFYFAGGDYKINDALVAQYYYGHLKKFYKQHFLGLVHSTALGEGTLKTDLRYFHSGSDGKNGSASGRAEGYITTGYWKPGSTKAGEVDNNTWSALFTYSISGHSLGLGYQEVNGSSDFPFLNQGDGSTAYLITDRQIGKFTSAGERTWLAEYGYDFAQLGIAGLKASVAYLSGDHIKAANGNNKEWERDLRVDYTLQNGALKGLGLSWRNASQRGNDTTDRDENRLIVSYTLPLL